MKNSTALTLLRVYQSKRTLFAATPLLREFVDQYDIGTIMEANVQFTPLDKQSIYDLLMAEKQLTEGQLWSTLPQRNFVHI